MHCRLHERDMDFYGVEGKDLDGVVSQLRLTQGVEVAMFLYEVESHVLRFLSDLMAKWM